MKLPVQIIHLEDSGGLLFSLRYAAKLPENRDKMKYDPENEMRIISTISVDQAIEFSDKADAYILDLIIPGYDRSQIITKVREHSDKPIFVLTSYNDNIIFKECREAGADEIFVKPSDINEYFDIFNTIWLLMQSR